MTRNKLTMLELIVTILPLNQTLPLSQFDGVSFSLLQNSIVHSCAIGSCMSLMLLLILKSKKHGFIYWLHMASLSSLTLRSGFYLGYLLSPLSTINFIVTGVSEKSLVSGFVLSIFTDIFNIILIALLEICFTYQISVMFHSPKHKTMGFMLTIAFALFSVVIVIFQIVAVIKSKVAAHDVLFEGGNSQVASWLINLPIILLSISINLMSLVLIIKLLIGIRIRRYLGLKQFDYLHVLLIMFSQTFIVPTILVIIEYKIGKGNNSIIHTIALTITVLSLPLGSMWAQLANDQPVLETSSLMLYTPSIRSDNEEETMIGIDEKQIPHDIADLINDDNFHEMKMHRVSSTFIPDSI